MGEEREGIRIKRPYFKKRNKLEAEISNVKARYSNEQMEAIFDWATEDARQLEKFRENEGDGTSNYNG